MKKLKMARGVTLNFEEGCNKYLENCKQFTVYRNDDSNFCSYNYLPQ